MKHKLFLGDPVEVSVIILIMNHIGNTLFLQIVLASFQNLKLKVTQGGFVTHHRWKVKPKGIKQLQSKLIISQSALAWIS